MSSLTITINGAVQVLQVGSLGAGASAQIAQAVSAAAASAEQAAAYAAELPSLVVQQSATFASLPANPVGLFLVLADETKGGAPQIYLFTASHRYWVAMVQDA
ncbi:hypothetical protein [Paraburkholderia aromaticivorans]|uniref:hypothetical protein n=1 Tax=Paraburkholderia aromaticivorans TaxID=2026199 RepID=UPI001456244B|nr:hypothetical protein [Paraburkholderia aromaticivorans]